MDIVTSQKLRTALPLFNALAISLLILAVGTILYLGREIFVPFALAILLSFSLAPIVNMLLFLRVPQGLAIAGAVLTALVAIGLVGFVILNQLSALATELPTYQTTMQKKIEGLASSTDSQRGPFGNLVVMLNEMRENVVNIGEAHRETAAREAAPEPTVVRLEENSSPFATVGTVVSPLLHPLATVGIVFIFAMFILAQREDLRNRFIRLAGTDDLQQTTAAIDDAARRLGKLLLTQLAVNTCFGLVISLGLLVIGVPSPFLWGILAGILRFVPYVGAVIGGSLPLVLAFAVDPGWSMAIWTVVLFLAVEPILGHVIEPLLYGHSSGLSPIAVILAAAIWALIWGPVGLILATPLTICLVVMGRYVPRLKVIDIMLGDRPALSPSQIFYQRMLGGATREAASQARDFLKERALATYYDEIALEGLRLAHEDVARFAVQGERLETLRRSTLGLVATLDAIDSPLPKGGSLRPEAAAAVDAVGPDSMPARIVRHRNELAPEWRGEIPVVCVAGNNPLDLPIAAMLAQVLTKHGLKSDVTTVQDLADSLPQQDRVASTALVCLCFVEPLSTLHLRHMARQVHRKAPHAHVMIGIWRQRDPQMVATLQQKLHVSGVVTSLTEALAAVLNLSGTKRLPATAPALSMQKAGALVESTPAE
ncbi:ABC transporter permease [Aureimonas endophytica]|uniref:ABC transporter permease n=1 Tax=Aureimonas endophytica TaxID=2027858 RepID=A0A917E2F1_9HYPH|nr:AI-2E family transporter [Aureimonas endophytica]GGD94026.1 ABC transporter permease [Aureimonas endophytica]